MSLTQTARQLYPNEYQFLASTGFASALRLLAHAMNNPEPVAFKVLCVHLECAEEQVFTYYKTGLPNHMVDRVLEILAAHRVAFGKHQLKPTKAVIRMHIAWKESRKRTR